MLKKPPVRPEHTTHPDPPPSLPPPPPSPHQAYSAFLMSTGSDITRLITPKFQRVEIFLVALTSRLSAITCHFV